MKVIKPQRLGVLTRPFEVRREQRLGVSVLAFIPLGAQRGLLTEQALWPFASEELGDSPVLDAGIPKSCCEYLVAASAYPALGEARQECAVRATVAGRQKTLLVSGDRHWQGARRSEAQPFAQLPLDWKYAFGGPGHAQNPLGRGHASEDVNGVPLRRLPNIEYPDDQMQGRDSRPRPAGFRALDLTAAERARKAGTHDARWLREDFPGFARDIDWTLFNIAPDDQQFDQDAFALDAAYEFCNLHPRQAVLAGHLPNLRARCFLGRSGMALEALEEVPLRLTTLWFFPSRERAVLVFQGAAEIAEDDASDVTYLLAAVEDAQRSSRPRSHFVEALARRLDPKAGHLAALDESDLCSKELTLSGPAQAELDADLTSSDLMRQRLVKRRDRAIANARAELASQGLDPDEYGLVAQPEEPVPELADLPAYLDRVRADAERQERELRAEAERRERENETRLAELGLDGAASKAEASRRTTGPPTFSAEAKAVELRQLIESFTTQGLPADAFQQLLDDPEQQRLWRAAEEQGREAYRLSAHLQDPAPARPPEFNTSARAVLLEPASSGARGADFTGVDLSGVELDGWMLEGALLESARLSGSKLRGAQLGRAVLAHADLRDADLEGADLRGANLGSAQLGGANLTNARLEGAILARANLERTRLDGADLTRADLSGARFEVTSFAGVRAEETTFLECQLRGVDFRGAQLARCNFLRADLSDARFCDADLSEAVFLGTNAAGADFARARLVNLRAVEASNFEAASFLGADLERANLRGCVLRGARFELAKLDGADLSNADLEGANLYRASALAARFGRAHLKLASFVGANLLEASLASARLDGADFTGANLFGADLSRVALDAATRFDGASLLRARIHPLRSSAVTALSQHTEPRQ